jgi:hypothetical protein
MAMSQVLSLLKEMRGRLGMYLGVPSLVRLAAFLRGYDLAVEKVGRGAADVFLPAFRDWIHLRFQSSQRSWEETILLHSANEADALKRFWELLDEFLQQHPQEAATIGTVDGNGTSSDAPGNRVANR